MMKTLLAGAVFAVAAGPALANEITVRVFDIASGDGEIGCALHSSAAQFPTGAADSGQIWQKADPAGVTCVFSDVAPGEYAVAVAHDLNGNRETDTSFLGLPQEDWGVSNNVRFSFRPPRFDEAQFQVVEAESVNLEVGLGR